MSILKSNQRQPGEIAQSVTTLVAEPDDLHSIPRTHMRERENWLGQYDL